MIEMGFLMEKESRWWVLEKGWTLDKQWEKIGWAFFKQMFNNIWTAGDQWGKVGEQ